MLLASSPPAQAASAIGSNRIAAIFAVLIFAKVPKRNSSTCPRTNLLDRAPEKWNSQSRLSRRGWTLKTAPTHGHWGSNGAWVGSDTRRHSGGNGDRTAPADQ